LLKSLPLERFPEITTFAQDPVFNTLDKALLESLDITVAETPDGFALIDDSTYIYAPHCERKFFLPALRNKDPALVICNDMEWHISGPLSVTMPEIESKIATDFIKNKVATAFPLYAPNDSAFNDLCIYTKSAEQADAP
jgi:SRR1